MTEGPKYFICLHIFLSILFICTYSMNHVPQLPLEILVIFFFFSEHMSVLFKIILF